MAAKQQALTVTVHAQGLRETLAAFRQLPKDAATELRIRTLELSEVLAGKARAAAMAEGGPAALMAPTVKAVRDRVPVVQVGGTRRVGRNRVPAWQLVFGGEFGMNQRSGWYAAAKYEQNPGSQFKPHRGQQGYWFFPLVESEGPTIARAWLQVADVVIDKFGGGG